MAGRPTRDQFRKMGAMPGPWPVEPILLCRTVFRRSSMMLTFPPTAVNQQAMTSPYAIADPAEPGIPEGFRRLDAGGPYFRLMGPVYARRSETGTAVIGLRVAGHHLNIQGITHGGMLTTLADFALGVNLNIARGRRGAQPSRSPPISSPARAKATGWRPTWSSPEWASGWPTRTATSRSGSAMCCVPARCLRSSTGSCRKATASRLLCRTGEPLPAHPLCAGRMGLSQSSVLAPGHGRRQWWPFSGHARRRRTAQSEGARPL